MKAVILAGGKGTRGRPYTDYFPKAMIPVKGVPLIQYIVGYLGAEPLVDEIIIISDFGGLGAQIRHYLEGQRTPKRIRFVQDSQSGTGGDLVHAAGALRGTGEFILWFADNFCALDIGAMKRRFDERGGGACIATRSKRKEETGFVKVSDGRVVSFREKPVMDLPLSECLGIYMLETRIIGDIKRMKMKNVNLSFDVLERLARGSQMSAYDIGDREWLDVESPGIVDRNRGRVARIIRQMGSVTGLQNG